MEIALAVLAVTVLVLAIVLVSLVRRDRWRSRFEGRDDTRRVGDGGGADDPDSAAQRAQGSTAWMRGGGGAV